MRESGQFKEALAVAQAHLERTKKSTVPHPTNIAKLLNEMGRIYEVTGQLDHSTAHYQKSIDHLRKHSLTESPDLAEALNNLGFVHKLLGRYPPAKNAFTQALDIRTKAYGDRHPETASVLNNLGVLEQLQGHHKRSSQYFETALSIFEEHRLPLKIAAVLNNVGGVHFETGRFEESVKALYRVVDARQTHQGQGHPSVAAALNNIGDSQAQLGRFREAGRTYERALSIRLKAFGEAHPEVADTLASQAVLLSIQGDHDAALKRYERASKIFEKTLGPGHPQLAVLRNNVAYVKDTRGDYQGALSELTHARKVAISTLGSKHPEVARIESNIGGLFAKVGDHDRSLAFIQSSLNKRRSSLQTSHPDVAASITQLASWKQGRGEVPEAERLYIEALELLNKSLGPNHPDVAQVQLALGQLALNGGRVADADSYFRVAIGLFEAAHGPKHYSLTGPLLGRGETALKMAHPAAAEAAFIRLQEIDMAHLNRNLWHGSLRERRLFVRSFRSVTDKLLSFWTSQPNSKNQLNAVSNVVLARKGVAQLAHRLAFQNIRSQLTTKGQALFDQLETTRGLFARLESHPPRKLTPSAVRAARRDLALKIDKLEGELANESDHFRRLDADLTVSSVVSGLPDDGVLVEYVVYCPSIQTCQQTDERYLALVIDESGTRTWKDVGARKEIDVLIERFRQQLAEPTGQIDQTAMTLFKLLVEPLGINLGAYEHLLVAPDGHLNLIPFAALKSADGRWLTEHIQIRYLTSGRELIPRRITGPKTRPVIVAAPRFDLRFDKKIAPAETTGVGAHSLKALPGTAREAHRIAQLLRLTPEDVLTGPKATEEALKKLASPRLLHIASHGVFSEVESSRPHPDEAMLRSGIALSGYNHRAQGSANDDGFLTAFEAAGLNLSGTELIVLSACETGVGDTRTGEGVYGLKRAMLIAGARTSLLSLWKVDDSATAALMAAYYTRLKNGEDRVDALRQVQIEMLKGRLIAKSAHATDQRGATVASSGGSASDPGRDWRHPYYWASFALSGADGSIDLSAQP